MIKYQFEVEEEIEICHNCPMLDGTYYCCLLCDWVDFPSNKHEDCPLKKIEVWR